MFSKRPAFQCPGTARGTLAYGRRKKEQVDRWRSSRSKVNTFIVNYSMQKMSPLWRRQRAVQRRRLTALRAPYRNRAGHRPWLESANAPSHRCTHARLDCDGSPPLTHSQCSALTQGLAQCRRASFVSGTGPRPAHMQGWSGDRCANYICAPCLVVLALH